MPIPFHRRCGPRSEPGFRASWVLQTVCLHLFSLFQWWQQLEWAVLEKATKILLQAKFPGASMDVYFGSNQCLEETINLSLLSPFLEDRHVKLLLCRPASSSLRLSNGYTYFPGCCWCISIRVECAARRTAAFLYPSLSCFHFPISSVRSVPKPCSACDLSKI